MNDLENKQVMADNIKRYMNTQGVTRKDLSNALSVPYTTISDWVNAKVYPRIDKIELMAKFFRIEKADLIEEQDEHSAPSVFSNRLKKIMSDHDMSQTQIAKAAGVSQQSVSNWLNGKQIPRMPVIEKLANHFHIPVSELLDEEATLNWAKIEMALKLYASICDSLTKEELEVFKTYLQ